MDATDREEPNFTEKETPREGQATAVAPHMGGVPLLALVLKPAGWRFASTVNRRPQAACKAEGAGHREAGPHRLD